MNWQEQDDFDFLDILAVIAFMVQMADYEATIKQSSNNDLMKEMRRQDSIYLQKIIKQNDEILKLLKN